MRYGHWQCHAPQLDRTVRIYESITCWKEGGWHTAMRKIQFRKSKLATSIVRKRITAWIARFGSGADTQIGLEEGWIRPSAERLLTATSGHRCGPFLVWALTTHDLPNADSAHSAVQPIPLLMRGRDRNRHCRVPTRHGSNCHSRQTSAAACRRDGRKPMYLPPDLSVRHTS